MKRFVIAFSLVCCLFVIKSASAEEEEKFKNLKVFPADISKDELIGKMKSYTAALGVRCDFCHIPSSNPNEHLNFAADSLETKETAREMIKMVNGINGNYIAKLTNSSDRMKVACITCHHGITKPESIENVLEQSYTSGGLEHASMKYDSLRMEYYGSAAYDFSEQALNQFAIYLSDQGNDNDALSILDKNKSYYGESGTIPYLKGLIYLSKSDTTSAIEQLEQALVLNPKNRRLQHMIGQLKGEK